MAEIEIIEISGTMPLETCQVEALRPLAQTIAAATRRELDALYSRQQVDSIRVEAGLVVESLAGWRRTLRAGETAEQRALLRQFVELVEVGRDVARLTYCFELTRFWSMPPTGLAIKTCPEILIFNL